MRRLALLVLLAGCDLFPPELLEQDGGAPDARAPAVVAMSDECGDAPVLEQEVVNAPIDLRARTDGFDGALCGLDAPGNDAFFAIPMEAGEKWHVHLHVRATLGFDPTLAVLDGCGTCAAAIDHCAVDQEEHLTFVAPADGTYVVAIDGRLSGGGVYDLLVSQPVCGDGGVPEHSETCDDGNTTDGDGCDSRCRAELASGDGEVEPNDDPTGANVLAAPGSFAGYIGGRCDEDHFVVAHGGGRLVATLGGQDGSCASPSATLELLDAAGTVLATGTPEGELCARLEATAPPGELLLRVDADPQSDAFRYEVSVQ
ncbi:MAG: DUF4215 domain-containing protein [Deltaproteobacteria bacterium]|nr:DUF4215 domain-containing protein [Deltaproteobacteria bacterium]